MKNSSARRGSRTYQTFTYHSQRKPTDMVCDRGVTYREAVTFLNKWQRLLNESDFTVVRKHDYVEGENTEGLVLRAYIKQNKKGGVIEE